MTMLNSGYYLRKMKNAKSILDYSIECINYAMFLNQRGAQMMDMFKKSIEARDASTWNGAVQLWADTLEV
jgi:hypothetical protein